MRAKSEMRVYREGVIRQRYADGDTAEIAAFLGITPHRVIYIARDMGIKKSAEARRAAARKAALLRDGAKVWQRWEDVYLEDHWADTPMEEIMQMLPHRTQSAISTAAHRLGLKRSDDFRRERMNVGLMAAMAVHNNDAPCPDKYGAPVGAARRYLIKDRPRELDRRALAPSARVFVSGSTLSAI